MLKKIDITFEDKSYSCEIKAENNESITIKIYQDSLQNFEGKITLKEIYSQIPAFDDYTMEELFNILNDLEKESLELLNSSNQFKLKIKIKVLKKIKELIITLEPKTQSKEEIIQFLLKEAINQQKRIEFLEKELKTLSELKKKGAKLEKEKEEKQAKENKEKIMEKTEENNFPDLDISKMKIQRSNHLFGKNIWVDGFKLLVDGRISMSLYEVGIAIINPDSLEIMYIIKPASYDYIGLKKDILAMIHDDHNKISIIKLEDTKYEIIQDLYHNFAFSRLGNLSNGTLLTCAKKNYDWGELIFYKETNNSYEKDFSIGFMDDSLFALQITNNEIIYTEKREEIVVYDFTNKLEKIRLNFNDKFDFYFSSTYLVEIVSDNLLCIVDSKKECLMINVREQKLVNQFKSDKIISYIHAVKGKYLFIVKQNCIMQYKVENDNISLIQEFETNDYDGLICLKNEKNIKCITYDGNGNIYELI